MNRRTLLLAAWTLAACRTIEPATTPEAALVELESSEFPDFSDDAGFESFTEAITQSVAYFARVTKADPNRLVTYGREKVPAQKVMATLERLAVIAAGKPDAATLQRTIQQEFRVFRSTGGEGGTVLFTGYYLPELHGSMTRTDRYAVPIHGVPKDLVVARAKRFPRIEGGDLFGRVEGGEFVPYPPRAEIAGGALAGKADELLFVDSAVDAFFLEIQGSGVVRFEDGSTRILTYAAKNGQPYVAIGAELVKRGALVKDEVSMQAIRAWLAAHPAEARDVMNTNPSYVFFRLGDAPHGSLDVPVTGGRSIATDTRVFPKGAPCFIDTERPVDAVSGEMQRFSRFVVDQDTGGAIRTAARVDVFWGSGEYAANAAGRMKQRGFLYYLLLR